MHLSSRFRPALVLAASFVLSASASAGIVWYEQPPGAGELPGSAQAVLDAALNPLDSIRGTLDQYTPINALPVYQVDLYKIYISDVSTFSARTTSADPSDDFALFLFDANGFGVAMNDDEPAAGSLMSLLTSGAWLTAPGYYYLGVGLGGYEAYDVANLGVFSSGPFDAVRTVDPARGALTHWTDSYGRFFEWPTNYSIELAGVTVAGVPTPGVLALSLLALAAVGTQRRAAKRLG